MGYASQSGRARTNVRNPQAFGVCDRCGLWYNHVNLSWQFDWAGSKLINKRLLVCRECYDTPQDQLRAIIIPADPVPIQNPRIEDFATAESNTRVTSGGNYVDPVTGITVWGGSVRATQANNTRVTQNTGEAPGGNNQQPGTSSVLPAAAGGTDPGVPYGFTVDPPESVTDVPETGAL